MGSIALMTSTNTVSTKANGHCRASQTQKQALVLDIHIVLQFITINSTFSEATMDSTETTSTDSTLALTSGLKFAETDFGRKADTALQLP